MAGLEGLASIIYHEKQQPGSALCAQHALNNLLQGNYFSAPDLSDIATNLDLLERNYRGEGSENGGDSTNMDDTGFFSIQVIENALKVWGLNLVRWRSEELSHYHDRPHVQLAFILNLEQHWFTLRRFGDAETSIDRDPGHGQWFNLNSFLKSPEWVGRLYLGMVLEQAEQEGYSVFAVMQADSSAPLALPRTEADMVAATLPDPPGATSASSTGRMFEGEEDSDEVPDGFEEEDFELQAALQASLGGRDHIHGGHEGAIPYESGLSDTHGFSQHDESNADPVFASMERNRLLLQRMRQQQEYAQREAWTHTTEGMTPEQIVAQEARREARRKQEEEEEENLQRAIAESAAMAQRGKENSGGSVSDGQSYDLHNHDDDDAELQAMLRASLEQANGMSASHAGPVNGAAESEAIHGGPSVLSEGINSAESPKALTIEEMRSRRLAKFGA